MKFAASDWEQQMSDRETLENRRLREEISAAQGFTRKTLISPRESMDFHGHSWTATGQVCALRRRLNRHGWRTRMTFAESDLEQQKSDFESLENRRVRGEILADQGLTLKALTSQCESMSFHEQRRVGPRGLPSSAEGQCRDPGGALGSLHRNGRQA